MTSDSGIPIEQPINTFKKEINIKFKDFLPALGKAGVDTAIGNWGAVGKDSIDILKTCGLASGKEEKAWLLVYKSLLQAIEDLIDETPELQLEQFDFKSLQKLINQTLQSSTLTINKEFFLHPEDSCVVQDLKSPLSVWLQQSKADVRSAHAKVISDRLPSYFPLALNNEWGKNYQDYDILRQTLDTPFTQADERSRSWSRYATWLQKQVEEPLFFEAFSLQQVFIPLRAYYFQNPKDNQDDRISRGDSSPEKKKKKKSY